MSKTCYYDVLGLSKTADGGAIKSAYRKLAMKYHPDRNPDNAEAEDKFREASEAYDVLKDEQKRAAYDRYGHAAFQNGQTGGGQGGAGFGFGSSFADIFEEMFGDFAGMQSGGAGGAANRNLRGADVRYDLEITLDEAFHGKTLEITVPKMAVCDACDGTGAEEGSEPVTCPTCHGAGQIRSSQGFFTVQRTCPTCQGAGQVIEKPCRKCGGSGRVRTKEDLEINIPAGVEDGTRMRVSGEGEAGMNGGPAGDLYVFIGVKPHEIFKREGEHLFCRAPIPMTTAVMGGKLDVPLVDGGKAEVTIPEGTQSGAQFRLKSKGMSVLRARHRGDMYVEAIVETPVKLSAKQKELFQAFADESKEDESAHPESHSFLNKVKSFWDNLTDSGGSGDSGDSADSGKG